MTAKVATSPPRWAASTSLGRPILAAKSPPRASWCEVSAMRVLSSDSSIMRSDPMRLRWLSIADSKVARSLRARTCLNAKSSDRMRAASMRRRFRASITWVKTRAAVTSSALTWVRALRVIALSTAMSEPTWTSVMSARNATTTRVWKLRNTMPGQPARQARGDPAAVAAPAAASVGCVAQPAVLPRSAGVQRNRHGRATVPRRGVARALPDSGGEPGPLERAVRRSAPGGETGGACAAF